MFLMKNCFCFTEFGVMLVAAKSRTSGVPTVWLEKLAGKFVTLD